MLKTSLKSFLIGFMVISAGIAIAALANRKPAMPPTTPSYCKPGGNWLMLNGASPAKTNIREIVAHSVKQDIVLLGEQHDSEDHHRWQLQMLAALHALRPDMVIGFEMFPRRMQAVLDQWVAGALTPQALLKQSEWDKVWRYPAQMYLPLFEFARLNRIPMRALNVDNELTRLVAEKTWEQVPENLREGVGRPAPPQSDYLAYLREIYEMHEKTSGTHASKTNTSPERAFQGFVDSQLTWDRAMAEGLHGARSLERNTPPPLVVGIMGSGHIRFGHGVPNQLNSLGVIRIASLLPVAADGECAHLQAGLATAVFVTPEKAEPPPEPPRLGVVFEDTKTGLQITAVTPGSLADKTGLRSGDRIIEIAGRPASGSADAVLSVRRQPPGTWLPLRIARGDSQLDFIIQFPPRP